MASVLLAALLITQTAEAPQQANAPESVERVRAALEQRPPRIQVALPPLWAVGPPVEKRFGQFTFVQSDELARGQIFAVRVPIGEWVMCGVNAVKRARYRHAEARAREEVQQALRGFLAQ